MIGSVFRLALLMSCALTLCRGEGQDATLVAGSSGSKIVDAVVSRIRSRCVFSEDRLFLRRLAKVKSNDGTASHTYRPNFHGGIWQVTESMFDSTKVCNDWRIRRACANITSGLAIQWTSVVYSELRKPLYSGLAAALSALLALHGQPMSGRILEQSEIVQVMYGDGAETFRNNSALPAVGCNDKLDLVFLLDSSGSVRKSDFKLMLNFTADVIGHLNLSRDSVRVADIVYSSGALVHFDFNGYQNKTHAQELAMSTPKESKGTNTALGLNLTIDTLYNTSQGARDDAKKVTILITDGRSRNFTATNQSAARLKELGSTVFAVGVGRYLKSELDAVASAPICSHVLTLTSFHHIHSLLTEILKITCEANFKLTQNSSVSGNITEEGSETTVETNAPSENETIEASVTCGILSIFVSTTDPRPSEAVYDSRYACVPGAPAYLTFSQTLPTGTTVYVTIVGIRLPTSVAQAKQCTIFSWTLIKVPRKNITVTCEENGQPRPCTKQDAVTVGLCQNDASNFPFDDPCTIANLDQGIIRHPYPYDSTKFIQCDMKGRAYVTQCPGGVNFNPETRECGFTSPPPGNDSATQESNADPKTQTASGTLQSFSHGNYNPCTAANLTKNLFYHEFPGNDTLFVQCDQWGKAYHMPCPPQEVWSQELLTCVLQSTASCEFTCSKTSPLYNADPCDPHKYIVCFYGRGYEHSCPLGHGGQMTFNPTYNVCV